MPREAFAEWPPRGRKFMARQQSRNGRGTARWIAAAFAACALAAVGPSAGAAGGAANADPIAKLAVYAGS